MPHPGPRRGNVTHTTRGLCSVPAGSPFSVKVTGEGRVKESITRRRRAPSVANVGSHCNLSLKIPGRHCGEPGGGLGGPRGPGLLLTRLSPPAEISIQDMTAQVTSPSGKTHEAEIVEGENHTYCIRFVPAEMGMHTVSVKYKGQHVPGSPFQFTVGPLGEGGAHKVRAGGPGLERAEAGVPGTLASRQGFAPQGWGGAGQLRKEPAAVLTSGEQPSMSTPCFPTAEFSIWTREAGAGGLAIAVEGPSKAEISFEDRKDGSCGVAYVVQEPGTESLAGVAGSGAWVWVLAWVYTDSSTWLPPSTLRAQGHPGCLWEVGGIRADRRGPPSTSSVLSPCAGDYEVSVKFNEEHIPDSPFVVPVASPSGDARRLTVSSLQVRHREKPPAWGPWARPDQSRRTEQALALCQVTRPAQLGAPGLCSGRVQPTLGVGRNHPCPLCGVFLVSQV